MSKLRDLTQEDIVAATMAGQEGTPRAVIDAFLPLPVTAAGRKLFPLTAGHELILAQTNHPIATGKEWESVDVLSALFIFSHQSRLLFSMISDGTFEVEFYKFIDGLSACDVQKLGVEMIEHWSNSRKTALEMTSDSEGPQKKTADSAGCSTPFAPRAGNILGRWIRRCMTFLLRRFSR